MTATLTSNVIGCEVKLTTPNNLQAISLAETLLAALEAFLATSLNERVYPYRSTLEIRMRPALFDTGEPAITAEVASGGAVEITNPLCVGRRTQCIQVQRIASYWRRHVPDRSYPRC